MMQRYDVNEKDRELYPQYYKDAQFVPDPKGRFVLWEDYVDSLCPVCRDAQKIKE
jgi:hypothetical protein